MAGAIRFAAAWGALVVAAVAFTGCKEPRETPADSGHAIYMARCAVCHGPDAQGSPGHYPSLVTSPIVNGPPERMAAVILDGVQGPVGGYRVVMPGWRAYLQDAEIASVMTWLRQRNGRSAVTPVQVNHVRIETAARNTFWTPGDLQNLHIQ